MKYLLIIFSLFLLVSCEQEKVEYEDIVYRNGLYYEKFSELPFTGNVVGLKQGKIKDGKLKGKWKQYWESGELMEKVNFVNYKIIMNDKNKIKNVENKAKNAFQSDSDNEMKNGIYLRDDHCDWGSSGMNEFTNEFGENK